MNGLRQISAKTMKWHGLLALLFLVVAIGTPRLLELDRFVTADEPLWLERSANFYCALSKGRLADTFQREHPGVVTMWAGTLGFLQEAPEYREECPSAMGEQGHEGVFHERGLSPLELLASGRLFVVLCVTLALALGIIYAQRLLGIGPAFLGFWLIAFDPFHVAHSRLLHLDGLLSSFMLLSILAFLSYLLEHRRRDLAVSAVAAGLGWLTKSPAFFLAPFMGALLLLKLFREVTVARHTAASDAGAGELSFGALWRMIRPLAGWFLLAALVFVALWPAMWVASLNTLTGVFNIASEYAAEGHGNALFFNGQLIPDGRLGIEFYYFYPLTYLWRATPVTLLGLVFVLIAFFRRYDLLAQERPRRVVIALGLFVVLFTLFMSLGAKKFDRYLLPVYPALDLLAGIGWAAILNGLRIRVLSVREGKPAPLLLSRGTVLLLAVLLGVQTIPVLETYPYYFSYYNPLLGGSRKAPEVMQIGWGEGIDQAARYLNAKPDAERLSVYSWYETGCFSYLFEGSSHQIPTQYEWDEAQVDRFFSADYVVIYIHQWQRKMAEHLLNYLALQTPERTIQLNDLEYARIYRLDSARDFYEEPTYQPVDIQLGDAILLEGYSVPERQAAPGDLVHLALSWRAEGAPEEQLKVFVHLLDGAGTLVAQSDAEPMSGFMPTGRWKVGQQVPDHYGVALPADLAAGRYTLHVGMYRPSGERLLVTQEGASLGDSISLGEIEVVD